MKPMVFELSPRQAQNNLGGGEGIEGLYGSITRTGTQKVLASMVEHCGLGSESSLVDVGAGLGRCVVAKVGPAQAWHLLHGSTR